MAAAPLLSCTCMLGLLFSLSPFPTWISPSHSPSPSYMSLYLPHPTHERFIPKEL